MEASKMYKVVDVEELLPNRRSRFLGKFWHNARSGDDNDRPIRIETRRPIAVLSRLTRTKTE